MTAMTLLLESEQVDPIGLGGQRVSRNERNRPHIEICWIYSSRYSIEQIREAWKSRSTERVKVLAVAEFKKSEAGRHFVKVDLFLRESNVPHIDEPEL